jgi:monoterpene epsilon-lactone hydrolase
MVMASRPEVATASVPVAAVDTVVLAQQMVAALARVPFRDPLAGRSTKVSNLGAAVTREVVRSFMGYASSLPIEEFRSIEGLLDEICRVVMPPVVRSYDVTRRFVELGGVPGVLYLPDGIEPEGVILYLHGGGYIGTSPTMYAFFTARLCRESRCAVFVADYRLAPEFPYPAGVEDAARVLAELVDRGAPSERLFIAGDSGGGGLATTLVLAAPEHVRLEIPTGVILFSPEVDLRLDQASVTENAGRDILPWNIPTAAYLHGVDPADGYVTATEADLTGFPPTFVAWGGDEMFRDPIRRFVERLDEADVPHEAREVDGMFHVFPILMPWADASQQIYRDVAAFIAARLAEAPPLHPKVVDGIRP